MALEDNSRSPQEAADFVSSIPSGDLSTTDQDPKELFNNDVLSLRNRFLTVFGIDPDKETEHRGTHSHFPGLYQNIDNSWSLFFNTKPHNEDGCRQIRLRETRGEAFAQIISVKNSAEPMTGPDAIVEIERIFNEEIAPHLKPQE